MFEDYNNVISCLLKKKKKFLACIIKNINQQVERTFLYAHIIIMSE